MVLGGLLVRRRHMCMSDKGGGFNGRRLLLAEVFMGGGKGRRFEWVEDRVSGGFF